MSAQRLSARKIRRISRIIGEPVVMGWAHGGTLFNLLLPGHRHVEYDSRTHATHGIDDQDFIHYSSCGELLASYGCDTGDVESDQRRDTDTEA